MATLKGVGRTNLDAEPVVREGRGEHETPIRLLYDKYTSTGVLNIGDIVRLGGLLPKGARIVGYVLKIGAFGGSADGKVGWAASAELDSTGTAVEAAVSNGLFDTGDISLVNAIVYDHNDVAAPAGLFKKFSAAVQLQVEITAATVSNADMELAVYYTTV